jgi:hypothetical protein
MMLQQNQMKLQLETKHDTGRQLTSAPPSGASGSGGSTGGGGLSSAGGSSSPELVSSVGKDRWSEQQELFCRKQIDLYAVWLIKTLAIN